MYDKPYMVRPRPLCADSPTSVSQALPALSTALLCEALPHVQKYVCFVQQRSE